MRSFNDRPIKQKLAIIIVATTASALLLAGSGIIVADSILFQGYVQRDLSALARIVADNSTAALSFNDPKTAAETLGSLRVRPHVESACVYRADGSTLARYARESAFACPPPTREGGIRSVGADMVVSEPIVLKGKWIGTLMLQYDLGELGERTRLYGSAVLGVLLGSSLIAFLLSSKLRAAIAAPVSQLVRVAAAVSETGDYSIRAERISGDELAVLVDRFNEMLTGIQSRDNALRDALFDREIALRGTEEERARFHFMAESMPQKIFTAKPHGEVDYLNKQWSEFTGLSFEQMKDWGWTQFIHPDDVEENVQAWRHSIETGEPFDFEHRFRRADGKYRWHLSRARAMRDAQGNISRWVGSNTDIHEQKEKEQELRRANDDLQQFAYSASHDLQEPIRNVAVFSELVARRYHDVLDAEGQQYLGFLREGGQRLARLISELLEYTRAGVIETEVTAVDSEAVLQQSLASLAEALRESGATVTHDPLPEVFIGEAHLHQVFQNLVANALKYRTEEPPRIHVSAARMAAAGVFGASRGSGAGLRFRTMALELIRDIRRKSLAFSNDSIMIRNTVVPASDWLSASGSLSVMAEEYGSSPNQGKEQFSISPSRSTPNQSVPRRFNLLLAEDNLPDALLVREAIRHENLPIDLHIVSDGQQAIDFIEHAESDKDAPCPQCMLLDLNLPKVEGFEILRRVRASEKCGAIPVVVITSSDSPADRSQAAALGAGYFRKPPSYEEFLKLGAVLKLLFEKQSAG